MVKVPIRTCRRHPNVKASTSIGMTLIEVLLGLLLLSVALIVFLTVTQAGNTSGLKGRYVGIATRAAADQIAIAEAENTSLLTAGTTTYTVATLPSGSMKVTIGSSHLQPTGQGLVEIDATVTWKGPTSNANLGGSVTMSTLVSAKK